METRTPEGVLLRWSWGGLRRMARRVARPGRRIDFKQWTSVLSLGFETAINTNTLGAGINFLSPATILRCRGFVQAQFDETQAVGDQMRITFGLGIVSSEAFAAGANGIPDPAGEPEYPWLWWGSIFLESIEGGATSGNQGFGWVSQRLEVDTKAMRKVKGRETLCWAAETAGAAGAPVTQIRFGQTRVLLGT